MSIFNRPFYIRLVIITILFNTVLWGVTTSCTRSAKSRVQSQDLSLIVKGKVVDPLGSPLSQAAVFLGQKEVPVSATSPEGLFVVQLDNNALQERTSLSDNPQETPTLSFYVLHTDRRLGAISSPVNFAEVGEIDLGVMITKQTSDFNGRIIQADQNLNLSLSNGSQILLGPFQTSSSSSGFFTFKNVPVGTLPLKINTPKIPAGTGFTTRTLTVSVPEIPPKEETINSGENQKELEILSPETFVVFQEDGPTGLIVPEPSPSGGSAANTILTTPTRRSFKLFTNSKSRFIRYHHDRRILENLPSIPPKDSPTVVDSSSSWKVIQEKISYDFPADGGQSLFYQFADLNKTTASEIYKVELDIDIFRDTNGFKIGEGEKIVLKSTEMLQIDVPNLAVAMRIAPDLRSLSSTPWQKAQRQFTYTFETKARDVPGSDVSFREIYLQFRDAFGRESKMFRQEATLDIFRDFDFVIADGTGIVRSRNVEINFRLTQDITGIRIAENRESLQKAFWQHPERSLTYALTVRQDQATGFFLLGGRRELCIQANSASNIESPVYCRGFEVELFNQNQGRLVVNDGIRIATSRLVKVNIAIPENAYEMRIFENGPDTTAAGDTVVLFPGTGLARSTNAERAWMVPVNETFYVFNTVGSRVLYLQFRTVDGIVSSIYQQSIVILPIAEAYGNTQIVLNSGSAYTLFPVIGVSILNLPTTATAMLISVNSPPNPLNLGAWQMIEPYVEIPISVPGPKTVFVLFRNSDREITPHIQKVIEFQPFPPNSMSITVNNGGNLTFTPRARVQLTAPPTAIQMRYSCDGEDITTKQYMPFQPIFDCSLGTAYSKTKRVLVQFRADNRIDESPVLASQLIEYREAFPASQIGLQINNGEQTTKNPRIQIKIDAPLPPTQFMRLSHISASDLQSQSWVPFYRDVSYDLPSTLGTYSIFVQLSDGGDNVSSVFSRNIELN